MPRAKNDSLFRADHSRGQKDNWMCGFEPRALLTKINVPYAPRIQIPNVRSDRAEVARGASAPKRSSMIRTRCDADSVEQAWIVVRGDPKREDGPI